MAAAGHSQGAGLPGCGTFPFGMETAASLRIKHDDEQLWALSAPGAQQECLASFSHAVAIHAPVWDSSSFLDSVPVSLGELPLSFLTVLLEGGIFPTSG